MARRRRPEKREILPDPKFGDVVLSKFMNSVMLDGKKSVAEGIVYGALETIETRAERAPSEHTMAGRLSGELLDAANNRGSAVKKREDTHRMAEANRAFSHYRW